MASIVAKNLCKIYPNKVKAVSDFNLEITDKEFIVLVGPSGCGKSTMLRMIGGLEPITAGELWIDGKIVNNILPKDRNVSMVFQNYALYPHMTAYENMAFGMEMRHIKKEIIRKKVKETAHLLGIDDLLDRKPGQMSGGQQQRIALGRAIVRQPSVFLLDEPLSNLDAKLRNQMRLEIIKLHQQLQTTFIYVTHDQTEAMTMADRVVVMNDGLIIQVDTPRNLYYAPANIFVASFIGTPQINLLDCTLEKLADDCFIAAGDLRLKLPKSLYGAANLEKHLHTPLVMGVRPDNIKIGGGNHTGIIELAEMLGSETLLHIRINDQALTAKISSSDIQDPNTPVNFSIDCDDIHLFDKETTERIILNR